MSKATLKAYTIGSLMRKEDKKEYTTCPKWNSLDKRTIYLYY